MNSELLWNPGCLAIALLMCQFCAQAGQTDSRPQAGSLAPDFTAQDQDGKTWSLADLIGKRIVLLYFYPKDNTPGCTAEACGLRDRMNDLQKGQVQVLGVSFDSAASHRKFREKYNLNFPLLVDPEGKVVDAYGARRGPGAKTARRVSFLIGLDGKIAHVTDNPSAAVHLQEMQVAIAKLRSP
ncbi:MAG: peroxiredoxin [Candidatus Omnitrophica bacterium]|nr:peroxiredoxin [Candidatus Omnitrophota bacterium]